jgi:hypothetical protein
VEDFVVLAEKVVCFNCRCAHVAGDRECPVPERQVELATVRG